MNDLEIILSSYFLIGKGQADTHVMVRGNAPHVTATLQVHTALPACKQLRRMKDEIIMFESFYAK